MLFGARVSQVIAATLCIVALNILAVPVYANHGHAIKLNTSGFRAYKKKKFGLAAELFNKSVKADKTYAQAHYNLACTLSLLRAKGHVCEHDATQTTIIYHINKAIALNKKWIKKALKDKDLIAVHRTLGFQRLRGLSPSNAAHAKQLLQNVTWYFRTTADLQPQSKLVFKRNGTLVFTYRHMVFESDDLDTEKRSKIPGKYVVKGRSVTVILSRPVQGKKTFKGMLKTNGQLVFADPLGAFSDTPDECGT